MNAKSLRLRLSAAAAISLTIALLIAGVGLVALFERQVVRRIGIELDTYIRQLAANVSTRPDGSLQLGRPLADPRFDEPLSGLYWQIADDTTGAKLRSRSLWDHVINLPDDLLEPGVVHHHDLPGPSGETLFVSERRVIYTVGDGTRPLRITAAIDRKEIVDARSAFAGDVTRSLAILAGVLLIASWGQIAIGLRPLEALRRSVNAVRSGEQKTITVDEPEEIMPLVAEVNSLLDAKAKAIESAKARAANLAHGLKTPLTVLATDAERLRRKGETEIADEIQDLAFGMRRHINRELSRARLQSNAGITKQQTAVRDVIESVIRTSRAARREPESFGASRSRRKQQQILAQKTRPSCSAFSWTMPSNGRTQKSALLQKAITNCASSSRTTAPASRQINSLNSDSVASSLMTPLRARD